MALVRPVLYYYCCAAAGCSIGSVKAARVIGGTRDRAIVRSRARPINDTLRLDGRFIRADPSSASFPLCARRPGLVRVLLAIASPSLFFPRRRRLPPVAGSRAAAVAAASRARSAGRRRRSIISAACAAAHDDGAHSSRGLCACSRVRRRVAERFVSFCERRAVPSTCVCPFCV